MPRRLLILLMMLSFSDLALSRHAQRLSIRLPFRFIDLRLRYAITSLL